MPNYHLSREEREERRDAWIEKWRSGVITESVLRVSLKILRFDKDDIDYAIYSSQR
jgi:hypothetical protein